MSGIKSASFLFLEISKLYTKFLLLFTDATDPYWIGGGCLNGYE